MMKVALTNIFLNTSTQFKPNISIFLGFGDNIIDSNTVISTALKNIYFLIILKIYNSLNSTILAVSSLPAM